MSITITSKVDGFRRAGLVHSRTPTTYADKDLTPAQLEQIKADPMLTIEVVKPTAAKTTAAKGSKTTAKSGGQS